MARDAQCNDAISRLTSLFPAEWIRQAARSSGWIRRERKVDPVEMFWTVILGFGAGTARSLAGLRRTFMRETGEVLVPSAFYDRFTKPFVNFLGLAIERATVELSQQQERFAGPLAPFKDVTALDTTVLRLHDLLVKAFPGSRTNHSPAAAKLHVIMSVVARGVRSVKITSERVHEGRIRIIGRWVKDRLLLFDLGYYSFWAFSSITANGGYFISRLKDGANPQVLALLRGVSSGALQPGMRLQEVLLTIRRDVFDIDVEVDFRKRLYAGRRRHSRQVLRVVGVWNAKTERYHLYVTNVRPEALTAEQVAAVFGGRWQVENLFKELKSTYRVADLPSRKRDVVHALILAAVLTMLVSHQLLRALAAHVPRAIAARLRPLRWAAVFRAHTSTICALLLRPRALSGRWRAAWFHALRAEALDPNASRIDLHGRLGVHLALLT